ncbi:hypothetical protein BDQ12DRAFT_685084 [Crucibulum laeve]|uniref:CS domain-containing protein n=1 Tax=Crucibulum laeve TaxID=68775 RepID=A0A5C3LX13_9AGAR|nr:hypothetical protein BDQ12DRAFT_685084 [Crucibulum laeve]
MKPTWTWSKEADGALKFVIHVSGLTKSLVASTTLDIEPRRLILSVPKHAVLDINLSLTDAEIVANASREAEVLNGRALHVGDATRESLSGGWVGHREIEEKESKERKESEKGGEPNSTLLLKRQRDLEVEKAKAEWRVGEGVLIVWC